MSCIAWDGKTLAADKRASFGTMIRTCTKIFRCRDGGLLAYAGDAAFGEQVRAWYEAGAIPADFPPSQRDKDDWAGMIVIRKDGQLERYERTPYPVLYEDRTFAIGCGRDFALAAMHLGKSARAAVEVAIALDSGCGNGIDTLELLTQPAPALVTAQKVLHRPQPIRECSSGCIREPDHLGPCSVY